MDANGVAVPVGAERGLVDEILAHKKEGGENLFLTRWQLWPEEEDTWLRASDFDDTNLLTSYWKAVAAKRKQKQKNGAKKAKRG
jgi:hypothetical protein